MDDFELRLSSGSFFRDDFYESFQAPKFYDFINPRDSGNADEWFSSGLTLCSVKEVTTHSVPQSIENASYPTFKKPTRAQLWKENSKNASRDSAEARSKLEQCCENDDPNRGFKSAKLEKPINKEGIPNAGRKVHKPMPADEHSPVSRSKRLAAKGPFFLAPATVPQKKNILAIRRAALELKGPVKSTKALFQNPKTVEPAGQECRDSRSDEGGWLSAEAAAGKNYSSGFEESCRRSGELPTCRRAIGQHRDSEAANYVVEQAVKLESVIKLLNLEDNEKSVKVCTEILGAVCTNGKPEQAKGAGVQSEPGNSTIPSQEGKHTFSFKATRQESTQQGRKRKSKDLTAMSNRKGCCRKVGTTVCLSPAVATSSRPALANSKKPRVTCPQPFRLRTEERGALKEIEFNKKAEQYIAQREGLCFSAAPMPASTAQIKVVAPLKKRPHRIQRPQTELADTRSPVEVSIEMITKQVTEQPQGTAPEERKARRPAMPSFHRPFRPQRSTKKLTVPIEPKFHTINCRRTCTKHSHATTAQ